MQLLEGTQHAPDRGESFKLFVEFLLVAGFEQSIEAAVQAGLALSVLLTGS